MKTEFFTEDGNFLLDYSEYLANKQLMDKIFDETREKLILGNRIFSYDKAYLREHSRIERLFRYLKEQYAKNPMEFFVPSGKTARDFINDWQHTISGIMSCNRWGKTCTALIKMLIRSIPTDKNWDIFKENGVKHVEFAGPKNIGIATYKWANHKRTIWPELRKWIPKSELGEYATSLNINWDRNPCIELACGTVIWFFCYEQEQDQFESQALDMWVWDEQGQEAKFDGANERMRTGAGRKFHIFSLTPHKLPGRPDTGAGGWIVGLSKEKMTKGHEVKFYHGSLYDVPDWVFPEVQKEAMKYEWVTEPAMSNNIKKLREGRARFFGEPHESSGLVYDELDKAVHIVDPFEIPKNWTRYRAIDHGVTNPTVCLWGAVDPKGVLYIYRELYSIGKLISENTKSIIDASGNELVGDGNAQNNRTGVVYERKRERIIGERYHRTVMDGRSCSFPDATSGYTVGEMYSICGLNVLPASGKNTEDSIPIVKEWLRVDPVTKKTRVKIFSNCHHFIEELWGYVNEDYVSSKAGMEKNPKERPRKKDDHGPDCLRFMIQIPPKYIDDIWSGENVNQGRKQDFVVNIRKDPITKY